MADGFRTRSKPDFLVSCLLVCCGLLTVASFTFAMYTVREFSLLKARVSELESAIANFPLSFPKSNVGSQASLKSSAKSGKIVDKISKGINKRTSETVLERRMRRRKHRHAISIHLERTTKVVTREGDQNILTDWKVTHLFGNVTYSSPLGCVVIDVPGIYLVYNQILYRADGTFTTHETLINSKKVLTIPIERHSGDTNGYRSSYQSAAFPLQRHDRVCVGTRNSQVVLSKGSYFGVALLSRT